MSSVFRNLAIIMLTAKMFGLLARKCRAPQVVGEIVAGLLIGPCVLGLVQPSDTIAVFAEIGVVLLMFSTGLGTNLKELLRAGPIATLVACMGVAVPMLGGTLLYGAFYGFGALGSQQFYRALFIGTIMTATSVSITVATLQELGKLKSTTPLPASPWKRRLWHYATTIGSQPWLSIPHSALLKYSLSP